MTPDPTNLEDQTIQTGISGDGPKPLIADRYQVIERLGKGGMGSVFRVRQILLDEEYALKILDADNRFCELPIYVEESRIYDDNKKSNTGRIKQARSARIC